MVGVTNKIFVTSDIPKWYPNGFDFEALGLSAYKVDVATSAPIWAIIMALIVGIISSIAYDFKRVFSGFKDGVNTAIGGSLLATMNTGAEYGFGGVIAALPGFAKISDGIPRQHLQIHLSMVQLRPLLLPV